ncbi:MAG: glycosyltransferase [Acidobacteria bacterium]|nr:glycosyltransferase [Acidobacteriota bacterium]
MLSFTTVFPSAARPLFGLFVWERLRHAAAGADVTVVAPVAWQYRTPCPDTIRDGVKVVHPTFFYVPGIFKCLDGFWLAASAGRAVARAHRGAGFDLVDAHFGYPDGVAAACLAAVFRRPFMVTLRGSELATYDSLLRRALMRWALRRAAAVVAVSQPLAELAQALGTRPERLTVVENGVDLERFHPADRVSLRVALDCSSSRRLLVSVGHLVPLKGFHRVVGALPALLEEFDVDYVVVGGPAPRSEQYAADLHALVERLDLTARVRFVGALPPADVGRWLQAADMLVLDSDREGCPNVVLEAMACGTPVAAASVGAVPDLLTRDSGVVYDRTAGPAALEQALRTALRRAWNPQTVRAAVTTRSWASVGAKVVSLWRKSVA